ncbi:MAG: competence/damage-inducible protein A [Proteobacteria bacterium]|nr:competence/damage-inducible protein A [Pseudomonadota bacterium]
MSEKPTVTAALIVIGNEVLSGRTQDANVQFLAVGLNNVGVRLMEARVIADVEDEIVQAINALRAKYDYVFTTGGIGPTHDDITSGAVAKAMGREFGRNAEAEAILRDHYRPQDVTEARLRMADMAEGAELIDNPVSRAPGYRVENVIVMPGVPRIMQAMFDGYKHNLVGGEPMQSVTITVALPEGVMAAPLGQLQQDHDGVEFGSYPFVRHGQVGTCLVARSADEGALDAAADALRAMIGELGGQPMED